MKLEAIIGEWICLKDKLEPFGKTKYSRMTEG